MYFHGLLLEKFAALLFFLVRFFFFFFLRLALGNQVALNSPKSACFCLLSAGIKSLCQHRPAENFVIFSWQMYQTFFMSDYHFLKQFEKKINILDLRVK